MKVRVECGPNDVPKRSCVLAVNKKAGEIAEKQDFAGELPLITFFLSLFRLQNYKPNGLFMHLTGTLCSPGICSWTCGLHVSIMTGEKLNHFQSLQGKHRKHKERSMV